MPETRAQRSSWRDLRRLPRHGSNRIDVVGAAGAGVHPAGYAVLQAKGRALLGAPGVRVDVDQPRCDDLAARVDRRPACVWMSISPGATILPRASIVSPASPSMAGPIAAMRPPLTARSPTRSRPTDGSMMRPLRMSKSYGFAANTVGIRASIAAPAIAAANRRRLPMVLPPPR